MTWEVFVAGAPKPQGSLTLARDPRSGREFARYSSPTVAWRQTLHGELVGWWWTRPPLTGPVAVALRFAMPRPKAHASARGGLKASAPHWVSKTPDLDKLSRAVLDSCTDARVWLDDAQVAVLRAEKRYAPETGRIGVGITIEELP